MNEVTWRKDLGLLAQLSRQSCGGGGSAAEIEDDLKEVEEATTRLTEILVRTPASPTPMLLWCPKCGTRHIDAGPWAEKHHHTHACQECGLVWRPAIITVGVTHLPGFKNG